MHYPYMRLQLITEDMIQALVLSTKCYGCIISAIPIVFNSNDVAEKPLFTRSTILCTKST